MWKQALHILLFFLEPSATTAQPTQATQQASQPKDKDKDQQATHKRDKKQKMSDSEVIAQLSERFSVKTSFIVVIFLLCSGRTNR